MTVGSVSAGPGTQQVGSTQQAGESEEEET